MLRPRQTQAPAEGGGIDLGDTFYDAAGRSSLANSPYYAIGNPSGALFVPSTTVPSQTQTAYDGAGRVSAQILLGNGTQKWRTSYAYGGGCASTPTSSTIAGPAPYWQSYTYDTIGNRLAITHHATTTTGTDSTDTSTYPAPGAPQPHAVTGITHSANPTPDAYAYNPDGSTKTRPGQALTYDSEGHQASVTAGGQTQSDIYDADGNRLLQTDPTGSTLYLGDTELHAAPAAISATGVRTYTALSGPIAERTTTTGVAGLTCTSWTPTPTPPPPPPSTPSPIPWPGDTLMTLTRK